MSRPLPPSVPDLDALASLFYDSTDQLGDFTEVSADEMPDVYRRLLAHDEHMTETVEAYHGTRVDVVVLDKLTDGHHYARKILLTRQSDGRVVQFGIMRVNFRYLGPAVQAEIRSERTPLGRVLIQHNVLRRVRLVGLWRVVPGDDLASLLNVTTSDVIYGRTALIECNGEPAIELIEIVTAADAP